MTDRIDHDPTLCPTCGASLVPCRCCANCLMDTCPMCRPQQDPPDPNRPAPPHDDCQVCGAPSGSWCKPTCSECPEPRSPAPLPPIAELRAVAENSTGGKWDIRGGKIVPADGRKGYIAAARAPGHVEPYIHMERADAEYIATFSPSTVLALLDRVEALERENEELRYAMPLTIESGR